MKIIVIGAGPAGMMACIQASKNKLNKVVLLEKNNSIGKKLNIPSVLIKLDRVAIGKWNKSDTIKYPELEEKLLKVE